MNRTTVLCIVLFCIMPLSILAEGPGLEEQLAEMQAEVTVAQQVNIELKSQFSAKETELSALKAKLKQVEDQIEVLNQELGLELN